jgi:hypothetical protein
MTRYRINNRLDNTLTKAAKRQHYIARFYLRNFAEPVLSDNLCVYDISAYHDAQICPELVQGKATPAALAAALEPLISQTPVRTAMLKELQLFREQMGEGGAAARAATILVRMLDHA